MLVGKHQNPLTRIGTRTLSCSISDRDFWQVINCLINGNLPSNKSSCSVPFFRGFISSDSGISGLQYDVVKSKLEKTKLVLVI